MIVTSADHLTDLDQWHFIQFASAEHAEAALARYQRWLAAKREEVWRSS